MNIQKKAINKKIMVLTLDSNLVEESVDVFHKETCDAVPPKGWVILDLAHVENIDFSGLDALQEFSYRVRAAKGHLILTGLLTRIKMLMSLTQTFQNFEIMSHADEAIEHVQKKA